MTEQEKCEAGLWYDVTLPAFEEAHIRCADLCFEYNHTRPSDKTAREKLLRQIFSRLGANPYVEPGFYCGFGTNLEAGDNFYVNYGCVFLDNAKIIFGDDVKIAPQCGFYTAFHPTDPKQRKDNLEAASPITVGNNVWFGAGVKVLPGVTIGDNAVIGAGSVVTHDIPANVIAFGNPCRPVKKITEEKHLP